MKRDPDLIRQILLDVEERCDGTISMLEFDDPEETTRIAYHVELLEDAGLIEGMSGGCVQRSRGAPAIGISRLTWAGHEFLDAARDDTNWRKAKGAMEKAGGWTLDLAKGVLVGLLTKAAQDAVGL